MDLDRCVGILIVQKKRKDVGTFDLSLNSKYDFSIAIGFTSSIKVVIDSFPTMEGFPLEMLRFLNNQEVFHDYPSTLFLLFCQ